MEGFGSGTVRSLIFMERFPSVLKVYRNYVLRICLVNVRVWTPLHSYSSSLTLANVGMPEILKLENEKLLQELNSVHLQVNKCDVKNMGCCILI
jgi:hypothetical protein